MATVSVIIPVYNAEKHLCKCLDSIVHQTLSDIEIVIVNDGSTDASTVIINEYALKYKNIKVISQRNQGLYKAREIGLETAIGDYVGWVDSDDFIDKKMYETLYNAAIQNSSDLVYCDYAFYPKKIKTKEKWFREYEGQVDIKYIERNSQPTNKLVRRALLVQLEIAKMFESCYDEAYIKVMLKARNPISIMQELYYYRMGQDSMSSSYKNIAHYVGFIDASKELYQQIVTKESTQYWRDYFEYRIIYYTLLSLLVCANGNDKKWYKSIKKQLTKEIPFYYRNQHLWKILKQNFGWQKAFVIKYIVPSNYMITRLICKVVFH